MPRESIKNKKSRLKKVIKLLRSRYGDVRCELNYSNPLELLIATILSAQCTDKRVNQVTPTLFKKYRTAKDYANASLSEIESIVRTTGFFKSKSRRIQSCCKRIIKVFENKVPSSLDDLITLDGVGRKTANVVLGNAFNIASGVVVDTHVTRLSNRLGFVQTQSAEKIEEILNNLTPKKDWIFLSHGVIHHGRNVCKARKPQCNKCFIFNLCPRRGV